MEVSIDLNTIISGLILLVLGGAVKGIFSIKDGQSRLFARVVGIETWTESHDKQDDERHDDLVGRYNTLSGWVSDVNDKVEKIDKRI